MKIADEERKLLTEYLGECWHLTDGGVSEDLMYFRCSKCNKWLHIADIEIGNYQRTFTTITDLHAVYSKMVEKGEWDNFTEILEDEFSKLYDCAKMGNLSICERCSQYIAWLFCLNCLDQIPERMKMVSEFIERSNRK